MEGSLKNLIFSAESQKSNIYGVSKNGVLGQFPDLRGRVAKKLGGVFEGG